MHLIAPRESSGQFIETIKCAVDIGGCEDLALGVHLPTVLDVSPVAYSVKMLKPETERVDKLVAAGASRLGAVGLKELTRRQVGIDQAPQP